MRQRGRKSGSSFNVIEGGITSIPRPDAPVHLTDEAANEWAAIVNRMPADWFPRETHPILEQYCRHVVAARRVADMIRELDLMVSRECAGADDMASVIVSASKPLDRLYKMQERESRAITTLATKMRLTQQATISAYKTKPQRSNAKPWEM